MVRPVSFNKKFHATEYDAIGDDDDSCSALFPIAFPSSFFFFLTSEDHSAAPSAAFCTGPAWRGRSDPGDARVLPRLHAPEQDAQGLPELLQAGTTHGWPLSDDNFVNSVVFIY